MGNLPTICTTVHGFVWKCSNFPIPSRTSNLKPNSNLHVPVKMPFFITGAHLGKWESQTWGHGEESPYTSEDTTGGHHFFQIDSRRFIPHLRVHPQLCHGLKEVHQGLEGTCTRGATCVGIPALHLEVSKRITGILERLRFFRKTQQWQTRTIILGLFETWAPQT